MMKSTVNSKTGRFTIRVFMQNDSEIRDDEEDVCRRRRRRGSRDTILIIRNCYVIFCNIKIFVFFTAQSSRKYEKRERYDDDENDVE